MGTKDITPAELKRHTDRKYVPGDRLMTYTGEHEGVPFDYVGRAGYDHIVVGDTGNGTIEVMLGHVARWQDREEIDLAIETAKRAGFYWKADRDFGALWWNDSLGTGYGGGSEANPSHSLVDDYGHGYHPCSHCAAPLKRKETKGGEFDSPDRCSKCNFWFEKTQWSHGIRIKGEHYVDGGATTSPFRGFGGRSYVIQMDNGRVIKTNNLWCQGVIPDNFKQLLPDNANWLKEETA